jgi:hypothetical protein
MKETESWEILVSLSSNEMSLAEAHDQILRLFSVVGQSEQLVCDNCGEGKPLICEKCYEIADNSYPG